MSIALLHRRLAAAMALSALLAFAAGAGWSAGVLLTGAALGAAVVRLPPPSWNAWIERMAKVGIVALCGWMLYVAFVLRLDFMPAVMAMLLFLLAAESLRALEARNDARLYLLAFALLIAATAYYPGLGFAAAFIAFVVLSTLTLMVGYLRRQAERFGAADVRLGPRMVRATIALSAVTLLISAGLFVLFPRLPRQWNVQGRRGGGEMMAGFGDEVRLGQHGGRIVSNPEVAFRVEFPDGAPGDPDRLYWRGRSFDRFDGERWTRSRGVVAPTYAPRRYLELWGQPLWQARIFGGPPGTNVLFGGHPLLVIEPSSAIRTYRDLTGDVLYAGSDAPVYTVLSGPQRPPEERLRESPERNGALLAPYLQLPETSARVRRLADSLTAGMTARIDRVRAVERYLSGEFDYTLELPDTRAEATIDGFLFRRRAGHCEYFASAMVVMLRSMDIPARNVTGFLGGEWNDFGDYLAVTGNQAHAWVEVWFPSVGWVPFDPTPAARGDVLGDGGSRGWAWAARFWFDGMEYRWYKWVVDYNLSKQLDVFRGIGDLFDRDGPDVGGGGTGGRPGAPRWLAVVIAAALLGAVAFRARRWRRTRRSPETRAYLVLRRLYAHAGIGGEGGPVTFAERLTREGAPGADAALELVALYVRARFAAEDVGEDGRARMLDLLVDCRLALREARRGRGRGKRGGRRREALAQAKQGE